ncbi:acyl-CoA N-acyltransferase [Acephala macrosclerotiorum]|nr:acyl-CoA N-acyltransferase [Acephala macrosclerotiorum]
MSASTVSISLAAEDDASAIASITTAAFAACDAAYPLIWGSAPEGTHDMIAEKGLFTPVQKEDRVTFKAVDDASGKIVGFVTWNMPKEKAVVSQTGKGKKGAGLPDLPGVNMELWGDKVAGPRQFYDRDVDVSKDMHLSFFFVQPEHQRRGIGSKLLQWGKEKGDELCAKIWITSTPQARPVYEKNGWKVVEKHEIDLGKYGGEGSYVRFWMLRSPA